jgi:hypothetical protein
MIRSTARQATALASGLLLAALPVVAQGVGTDTAAQGYAPPDYSMSSEAAGDRERTLKFATSTVLPPRSDAELDQAIKVADQALNRADTEFASANRRRGQAEELRGSRELQLRQVQAVKGRKGEEVSKSRRDSLEAEERALKRRVGLMKDLEALANLEIEAARAAREAAIAEQQALESERMLVRERAQDQDDTETILALVRETLLAKKKSAGLVERLGGKRELVSSKRLDLYRAYLDARKWEGS